MPKIKLSNGEINEFSDDIAKILNKIPLFYVYEVLEKANEDRQRDGELSDLDISDEEEEYQSSSEEEEDTDTDSDE
jgi:hypothetical protein